MGVFSNFLDSKPGVSKDLINLFLKPNQGMIGLNFSFKFLFKYKDLILIKRKDDFWYAKI